MLMGQQRSQGNEIGWKRQVSPLRGSGQFPSHPRGLHPGLKTKPPLRGCCLSPEGGTD